MKKLAIGALILTLSTALITGCTEKEEIKEPLETKNTVENHVTEAGGKGSDEFTEELESEDIDLSNVSNQLSESARDVKLEKAIIEALEYDKETDGIVRYYYNRIDLNGDEKPETFVYLLGPYVSGSGGSTAFIFENGEDGYKVVSRFTLVRNPIIVSDNMTNGWKDLIMYVSGGGIEPFYAQIKFDGSKYPSNPSVQPQIKSGTVVKGTAIIADDTLKNPGIELQ